MRRFATSCICVRQQGDADPPAVAVLVERWRNWRMGIRRRAGGRRRAPGKSAFLTGAIQCIYLLDRKSTRLNSSHSQISYAGFCLKKKKVIDAGPTAIPPNTAPIVAADSVGAADTNTAAVIHTPERLTSLLGVLVRS